LAIVHGLHDAFHPGIHVGWAALIRDDRDDDLRIVLDCQRHHPLAALGLARGRVQKRPIPAQPQAGLHGQWVHGIQGDRQVHDLLHGIDQPGADLLGVLAGRPQIEVEHICAHCGLRPGQLLYMGGVTLPDCFADRFGDDMYALAD